ncbi:MAG: hypothetical protein PUI41_03165 [Lachnospiraceae bacterium]|nr:hypothetical protein [Lachnospiraceae bacterium]MCI7597026.1 hypothetical protein [Lachnospiraceae bacterium]MDD7049909.1 hypothetical protein [Lachnospiraceae bacterium]MDY3223885.1 hypothetical protein [Lachnospiraceae bacterium]MDY4098047.1 hypothetical protein [Lachnospiraceae bacterium]
MKFPFFASFIILCLVVRHAINRNNKLHLNSESAFWARENSANEVRKQSLEDLNYISFSFAPLSPDQLLDNASLAVLMENPRISEITERLIALENSKIVNLNYITNTELKSTYGVANLALLTEYDQNYTDLITLLQEYASILAENGFIVAAQTVLETAIFIGTDISSSYSLAASIYREQGLTGKISELITQAEKLNSPRKNTIVRILHTTDPDND